MALTAFLALVVVPLVLLAGTYVWLRISDSYALDHELTLAREAGYPLTLEELNASYPTSPEIEAATAHWQKAIEIVASEAYRQATKDVPIVGTEYNYAIGQTRTLAISDENSARGRAFAAAQEEALEAVHAARLAGATARFPVEFDKLLREDCAHAQGLRDVVRLLELDLEIRLADGDAQGAVDDVLSMIAASDALANEPHAITQLVRMALIGIAAESLTSLLSRVELTDENLASLQEAFARQRPMDGLRLAVRQERYAAQYLFRGDSQIEEPGIEDEGWRLSEDGDIAKSMQLFRRLEEALEQEPPAAYAVMPPLFEELEVLQYESYLDTFRYLNTLLLRPMIEAIANASARSDATCRLAETAIAFGRYRQAHGSLPPSPEAIVPAYLDSLPIDTFDGNPVRWRVVAASPAETVGPLPPEEQMLPKDAEERVVKPAVPAGVVYYSVWSDGKDDGGMDDEGGFDQSQSNDLLLFVPDRIQPEEGESLSAEAS